jgi:hypothetical protein
MRVCLIVATIALACASSLSAQSLADVARKEGERREGTQPAAKTYTNKDLKAVRAADPAAPAQATPAADAATPATPPADADAKPASGPAAGADTPKAPDASAGDASREVKDQAYWAKRLAGLRDQLSRDETYVDALQTRINALTMDFVNRDDPIQRDQIERDRSRAVIELERLKKAIEQDRKAIADLEEEARRAGVPAGWLR